MFHSVPFAKSRRNVQDHGAFNYDVVFFSALSDKLNYRVVYSRFETRGNLAHVDCCLQKINETPFLDEKSFNLLPGIFCTPHCLPDIRQSFRRDRSLIRRFFWHCGPVYCFKAFQLLPLVWLIGVGLTRNSTGRLRIGFTSDRCPRAKRLNQRLCIHLRIDIYCSNKRGHLCGGPKHFSSLTRVTMPNINNHSVSHREVPRFLILAIL